jgi:multiple sugar transport system substrate-binding protein
MKKWLFVLLTLSMFLLIVGCSNDDDAKDSDKNTDDKKTEQTEEETPSTDNGEKTVIKFAAQSDSTPATDKLIETFNNSQDKYVVEWTQMTNDSGQMHDQLLTSLSSGSDEYDVISMDVVWAGEFAGAGFLEPIDVMMNEAGLTKDQFNAGSMASGNYGGKQYTLPYFPDLGLLYYRSDIVSEEDQAKLISGDYTYDDLAAMAEKYAGEGGTEIGFVYQSKQYEGLTVNLTEFSSSFANVQEGLETMYEFTKADWTPNDILNYDEGATQTAFEQGKAVFARNWPYQYGNIMSQVEGVTLTVDQVGVAPLPNGSAVGGWLLGINKNSKNIEGAWEFIKFVAGEEGQKIMATQGGYIPGFNSLLEDEEVLNGNKMLTLEGFQNALATTISRPVSADYASVSDTIQVEAHKYLSSGEGLDAAVSAIEDAISE